MIIASAIKLSDGKVFVGKRHGDCFSNLIDIYEAAGIPFEKSQKLHFNCIQGFINDKLKFLDRTKAYFEAYNCKQCERKSHSILMSEDLW